MLIGIGIIYKGAVGMEKQCADCWRVVEETKMKRALFSLSLVCSARCEINNAIRVKSHPDKYTMRYDEECRIKERWEG